jgi:hypothetical protein
MLKSCLIFAVVGLALVYRGMRHGPVRHEITTQRPGEARPIWRSMRTAWTFRMNDFGGIEDVVSTSDRLYYIGGNDVGCLDKSSGRPLWQYCLTSSPIGVTEFSINPGVPCLAVDDRCVYACLCGRNRAASLASYCVCALDAHTGAPVWQHYYAKAPLCPPCPAGSTVLLTDVDGKVTAVRQNDGSTLWQRSIARTSFAGKNGLPQITLQATGGVGVAQIGGRLLGFRLTNGRLIWERRCKGETALQAEDHDAKGFAVKDGIVYAFLANSDLVAVRASTGRPVWTRRTGSGGSPSSPVWLQGDYVFTCLFRFADPGNPLVALRRSDGATAWLADKDPPRTDREAWGPAITFWPGNRYGLVPDEDSHTLLEVAACEPVLDGVPRRLRSLETLGTVIARDPATGREQWRWQPDQGTQIDHLIPDGDRLIVSNGHRLLAFEEGMPDSLPTDPRERQHLIRRLMNATFDWNIGTPLAADRPDWTQAQLTLLRLGRDSVSPLLDYVRRKVDEANAQPARAPGVEIGDSSLDSALDLLFDLNDPETPAVLARELDRATHPGFRKSLAEALIRWGDSRALPALFRYVQSGSEERDAREESLYFVCRRIDEENETGHAVAPSRAEITSFLLARLNDSKAADWLHSFARFELLDDRGEAAYRAAFATFKQRRGPSHTPGATSRPHVLTEEEAIYQAVIEGLCQYGRWLATTTQYAQYGSDSRFPYGTNAEPLILPAPPGSTGVEILGHPGPVRFVPYQAERFYTFGIAGSSWFQHPFIGLDGRWLGRQAMPWEDTSTPLTDPFKPPTVANDEDREHRSFHAYFPYTLSADHKRAGVGWELDAAPEGSASFDIEVRKVGGRWLPVQCRRVYGTSSFGSWHTTVPIAR